MQKSPTFRAAKLKGFTVTWSGLYSASESSRPDAFLSRCKRVDYCVKNVANISDIFSNIGDSFFEAIMKIIYMYHVPHHYLPETKDQYHNLRQRFHNKTLITKTTYH